MIQYMKDNMKTIIPVFISIFLIFFIITYSHVLKREIETKNEVILHLTEQHQIEIEKYNTALKEAEEREEKANKDYKDAIQKINKEYEATLTNIESSKAQYLHQLIVDYGDDPHELAEKISAISGYEIFIPSVTITEASK